MLKLQFISEYLLYTVVFTTLVEKCLRQFLFQQHLLLSVNTVQCARGAAVSTNWCRGEKHALTKVDDSGKAWGANERGDRYKLLYVCLNLQLDCGFTTSRKSRSDRRWKWAECRLCSSGMSALIHTPTHWQLHKILVIISTAGNIERLDSEFFCSDSSPLSHSAPCISLHIGRWAARFVPNPLSYLRYARGENV